MTDSKKCTGCGETKALTEFHKDKGKLDGLVNKCKVCKIAYTAKYQKEHKEKVNSYRRSYWAQRKTVLRDNYILKNYGLTPDDYLALLLLQKGRCAICFTDIPGRGHSYFVVDHDHKCCSGRKTCGACIRGLLCHECNTLLGLAKDNIITLNSAISYLERR